jgi:SAM-dependent methyltransferase
MHPDLQDIPAAHTAERELADLLAHLQVREGRLLDIGCNLGVFCHHFVQIGLDCVGVEIDPDIARAAERLALSEHQRLKVHSGDILSPDIHDPLLAQGHDVVLALNVLHRFLKTKESFEQMRALLSRMRPRQMFLGSSRAGDPQMSDAYARLDETAFVALVQRCVGLPLAQPIHRTDDGRTIFSLCGDAPATS